MEINTTKKNKKTTRLENNKVLTAFTGRLGADVTYNGELIRLMSEQGAVPYESTYRDIRLAVNGQLLATINAKNALADIPLKRKPMQINMITVISPNYKEDGVVSKEVEALNRLQVFHQPDETPDSVIDNLCDIVAYSKAKVAYDKKYTHLNIATKLADLAQDFGQEK